LIGSAVAATLFGILGQRARERDSAIGVVLAFGLGLAVLFIHLYPGGQTGRSGLVLSLAPAVPVSVFVATISFVIYLVCWLLGRRPVRT
jgi:zinc/manganese transport system permease protein